MYPGRTLLLLLAHPTDDRWTPLAVSQPFFDCLGGEKELVMLDGCGHFPYEDRVYHGSTRRLSSFWVA